MLPVAYCPLPAIVGSDAHIAPVIAAGNDAAVPAAEASGDASLRVVRGTADRHGLSLKAWALPVTPSDRGRCGAHCTPLQALP